MLAFGPTLARLAPRVALAAAGLTLLVARGALAQAPAEPPAPAPDAPAAPTADEGIQPPRTLAPVTLPLRRLRKEVGLGFGLSGVSIGPISLTTITGVLYVETRTDERFGIRLQLPVASAGSALVGDVDLDPTWVLWAHAQGDHQTLVMLGADFTIPTNLLDSLGGSRDEIRARRLSNYPEMSALNLLPIRYLQAMPHVGFMQRLGRLAFYADLGAGLVLGCQFPNYYDSPRVEAFLEYGLGAAYEVYRAPNGGLSLAGGLELTATQFLTTVAPTLDNQEGSSISPDPRETRPIGLSIAPSVRLFAAHHVSLKAGAMIALVNDETWTRFTPSTLWRHDFTVFAEAGFDWGTTH